MLRLFACLMKSEDGYTAVECGILGCLAVIFVEKLIAPF
jgi:Flp pilus assembly pilin Flp